MPDVRAASYTVISCLAPMTQSPSNLEQLVQKIAVSIGATEAAAFRVVRDPLGVGNVDLLVHLRPDDSDAATRQAAVAAFEDVIAPCLERGSEIEVGADTGSGKQFCLVVLARRGGDIAGAAAFIVRSRNEKVANILLRRVQRAASGH